jgi:CubicO group peptidase (beta-lactamase class C family)
MHMNHLPTKLLPWMLAEPPAHGLGFGLGSRVVMNVAETQMPGSAGMFGWSGAAKTDYWVDPQEEMVILFMSQSLMQFDLIKEEFHILAYQSLID